MTDAETEYSRAVIAFMAALERVTAAKATLLDEWGEAIPTSRQARSRWTAAKAAELGVPRSVVNTLVKLSPAAEEKRIQRVQQERAAWQRHGID